MSRLNLNSIRSWVDSHIIDYSTAMLKLKNARMFILVFFVSLYLLFFVSPVLGIILLLIFTLYLLYNKKYKNIFLIWGRVFFIWYLVFTACLIGYDGPILITPDFFSDEDSESRRLFFFLMISIGILVFYRAYSTLILKVFVCKPLVYYVG